METFRSISSLIPVKLALSVNASMIPISFRVSPRLTKAEMENLGIYKSTDLNKDRNKLRRRKVYNQEE